MNETFFSELGQRISWALVHSLWQFALVAAVLAVALRLSQGRSPHLRYGLMFAAMVVMTIAPVVTFGVVSPETRDTEPQVARVLLNVESEGKTTPIRGEGYSPIVASGMQSYDEVGKLKHRGTEDTEKEQPSMNLRALSASVFKNFVRQHRHWILAGWLAGVLILSIRPLIGWRATRALRSRGLTSVSDSMTAATARVAQRLGVRRVIEIAQSSLVEVPTVIGWLKPLVLLPASAVSGLSTQQLEAVIAHEIAHVRRHDYLVNLLQLLMETVFFYHPAVWWVSHRMRIEREECCDDIAVNMTGDRVGYAKLLVWLEETRGQSANETLAMSSDGGSLLGRVRRLFTPAETTSIGPLALIAVTTFALVIGSLVAINSGSSIAQEPDSPDEDRFSVQVGEDVSVKLLAILPHQASADKAWKPNGENFAQPPTLPKMLGNSSTRQMSGINYVFQFGGLANGQNPVYRTEDVKSWRHPKGDGLARVLAQPSRQKTSVSIRVGIPDESWGPWVSVNAKGKMIDPVVLRPRMQQAYKTVRVHDAHPSGDGTMLRWANDREEFPTAIVELIAIDKQGERQKAYGSTLWDDENDVPRDAEVFELPIDQIDHFEYRLRPYRHWVTFENVSLRPGQDTNFKISLETVATPAAKKGVSFSGRIVGPDGLPATSEGWMYYSAKHQGGSRLETVGKFSDTFRFRSIHGESYISHFPKGFAPTWSPKMNVQPGDIVEGIVMQLQHGNPLTVQIQDTDNNPVADATLIAHPLIHGNIHGPNFPVQSGPSGVVRLEHIAKANYRCRVEAAGFETLNTEPLPVPPDSRWVLTLQRAKPATGVVLSSDGKPVAGAKLRVKIATMPGGLDGRFGNEGSGFFGKVMATTNALGEFSLDRLDRDKRYLFIIEGPDGSRLLHRDFQAGQSELHIELPKRHDLRVEITGNIANRFKSGVKPYVKVRQKFALKHDGGTIGDLAGDRAAIELTDQGGVAVFRGLVVDPESELTQQSVQLTLGAEDRITKEFTLSDDTITSLQWNTGARDRAANQEQQDDRSSSLAPPANPAAQQLGEAVHRQLTAIDKLPSCTVSTQTFTSYYGDPKGVIGLKNERSLEHLRAALKMRNFDRSLSTADQTWTWTSDEVIATERQKYIYEGELYDQGSSRTWNGTRGWYRDSTGSYGRYRSFADSFENHYFKPSRFLHLGDHALSWVKQDDYPTFFVNSTIPLEYANYQSLPDEDFGGEPCSVIRSIPRQEQFWVGKQTGQLRGCLTFIGQGKFTRMHEMKSTRKLAGKEFQSDEEFRQWLSEAATQEQRYQLECDFWYLHQDNQHPSKLIDFSDYQEVEPGIQLPMTEWWSSWMHAGKKYQYNVHHAVVRNATASVDLKPLVDEVLPKKGDTINDWRFVTHVKYPFDPDMPESEIHAMVDEAQNKRLKNQKLLDNLLKPLQEMIGKPAPKLEGDWVDESEPPSDSPSKPMLLHFWATWCGPCKNDIPQLNRMAEAGWNVVGVHAPGTKPAEIEAAIKENSVQYPVLLGREIKGTSGKADLITGYPVRMFPCCVLVGKDGAVQLIGSLDKLLKQLP